MPTFLSFRRLSSVGAAVLMFIMVLMLYPMLPPEPQQVRAAATIFIDSQLSSNCTSGNYSIVNRSCSGSNGNAYTNIQDAYNASSPGDTVNLRTGSYTSNMSGAEGIIVKDSQTWQTYPGDAARATITAASSHYRVFIDLHLNWFTNWPSETRHGRAHV